MASKLGALNSDIGFCLQQEAGDRVYRFNSTQSKHINEFLEE